MLLTTNSNSRTSCSNRLNIVANIRSRSAPVVPVVRSCGTAGAEIQPKFRSWALPLRAVLVTELLVFPRGPHSRALRLPDTQAY